MVILMGEDEKFFGDGSIANTSKKLKDKAYVMYLLVINYWSYLLSLITSQFLCTCFCYQTSCKILKSTHIRWMILLYSLLDRSPPNNYLSCFGVVYQTSIVKFLNENDVVHPFNRASRLKIGNACD